MRMGGGFGVSSPVIIYRRSGELAGTMPASWRDDCADLATCQLAVSVTAPQRQCRQRHIVRSFIPR